jgi:hypothetical protein
MGYAINGGSITFFVSPKPPSPKVKCKIEVYLIY